MTTEATIRTLVLSDATILAAVVDRMYTDMLPPEATIPAITYSVVHAAPHVDTHADLYMMTRIQFDIYSSTKSGCATLYSALVNLLHMYTGTVGTQDIVGITIDFVASLFEPETHVYRYIVDAKVTTKGV